MGSIAIGIGLAASVVTLLVGFLALRSRVGDYVANRKTLIVTTYPNHAYTQKDGSLIIGLHLDTKNPAHKSRSINAVRLSTEPRHVPIGKAYVHWSEPGSAELSIDSWQGEILHKTPAEDVLKFPLEIPPERRVGGLFFVYLKPPPELWRLTITMELLADARIVGSLDVPIKAVPDTVKR